MKIMNILSNMVSTIGSTFDFAFDNTINQTKNINNLIIGENNSLFQATVANSSLDFDGILCEYFLLMRCATYQNISEIINKLINILESNLLSEEKRKEILIKIMKISLFIRNPRKGKGEKKVFYYIIEHLYSSGEVYKKMCLKMLNLIGEFGYYKDLNNIYVQTKFDDIKSLILEKYTEQIIKDNKINCEADYKNISLAAKWAPREGSKFSDMAKALAKHLIIIINPKNTDTRGQLKQYRQILSGLNKKINTVQTFMCQKHWGDIEFKNVPSVSMTNLTKAFQDEKVSPFPKSQRIVKVKRPQRRRGVNTNTNVNDNRRHHVGDADYEDREKCKQNLITHISSGNKVNATVSNLSQIIQQYLRYSAMDIVWEAQWESRVKEIQNMISQLESKPSIFPMVDLSSSMSGDPMINAITLGMFTSMIMDNPLDQEEFCFANRFMSFSSEPSLVKLPRFSTFDNTKPATLKEKVEIMKEWTNGGRWGGSTNIHKALDLLLSIATDNKVSQDNMPKILAIFSDMQFDEGDNSWNKTSYENICDKFKNAGYEVPHIIFWNLRSNTVGFQVKAYTPNSSMLSGYSTRMLDLFLSGDTNKLEELKTKSNKVPENEEYSYKQTTTLDLLNKALKHEMFEKYLEEFNNLF